MSKNVVQGVAPCDESIPHEIIHAVAQYELSAIEEIYTVARCAGLSLLDILSDDAQSLRKSAPERQLTKIVSIPECCGEEALRIANDRVDSGIRMNELIPIRPEPFSHLECASILLRYDMNSSAMQSLGLSSKRSSLSSSARVP